MKYEYRLVWKRNGVSVRQRKFTRLASAEKYQLLLGKEPWKYGGQSGDDYKCCSGMECGCGGITWKEHSEKMELPEIEFTRIDKREVSDWQKVSEEKFEVKKEAIEKELEEVPF